MGNAERLAEALDISRRNGLACDVALQPHYNLMERAGYESGLAPLCAWESGTPVPTDRAGNLFRKRVSQAGGHTPTTEVP